MARKRLPKTQNALSHYRLMSEATLGPKVNLLFSQGQEKPAVSQDIDNLPVIQVP
jgi:hypothetical protein